MAERSRTPPPKKTSLPEVLRTVAPYLNIGWTFVAAILLCILIGRWVDSQLGTEPWFFVIGAVLGIVVGFYSFFATVLRK